MDMIRQEYREEFSREPYVNPVTRFRWRPCVYLINPAHSLSHLDRQIAEAMFLSEKTITNYVTHLLAKLKLNSRTEAAVYATKVNPKPPRSWGPQV